jgi:hypothetical protein
MIKRIVVATVAVAAACSSPPIEQAAAVYESPLVRLQQLVGRNNHLHTDEVRYRDSDAKLFHCSYNFGVIDARDPAHMRYLAEGLRHRVPGDDRQPGCIHLAWDGDVVYTSHRGNIDNPAFLSGWRLRPDPAEPDKLAPEQLPAIQEPGVSYEGIDAANGLVYVALRRHGLGIYRPDARRGLVRIGTTAEVANAWGVRVRGTTAFVTDSMGALAVIDVSRPERPSLVGRVVLPGQARGLDVDGTMAYVAAGSAGLVTVDVSDPARPRIAGSARVSGSAIRVDYADGFAHVAAWNDARVYDVSTPSAPRFVGAARMTRDIHDEEERPDVTSRTLGVAAAGRVMFAGNWHIIHSFALHPERQAPSIVLPEAVNLVDFGPVRAGAAATVPLTVKNQGTAPLTLFDPSVSHAAFTVEPARLDIAPGESATLTIRYHAADDAKATAALQFATNDPDNPTRRGYLVANQPGLGVGKALPELTLARTDGGRWTSAEAKGHVTLLAYFATF